MPSRAGRCASALWMKYEEIVWRHKLAPETLRLPAKSGVTEIQVFEIALKTGDLREDVLRTIDRAVPSLIFFELTFEGRVRFAASYKRASEIAANQPVVETYFETPWQDAPVPRLAAARRARHGWSLRADAAGAHARQPVRTKAARRGDSAGDCGARKPYPRQTP